MKKLLPLLCLLPSLALAQQIDIVGQGVGTVVGPTSATDNAIVRFDATTGRLVQNSGTTISDVGTLSSANLTAVTTLSAGGHFFLTSDASSIRLGAASDTNITRKAAAGFQLGQGDAASPVAQALGVQSVVTGTSNTAGVDWTLRGSAGTGTGVGGKVILQIAPAGSTGTAQNAFVTSLTLNPVSRAPQVPVGVVSALPTCGSTEEGSQRGVTDAAAPAALATVAGGGAVHVSVYCNGTNWIVQ